MDGQNEPKKKRGHPPWTEEQKQAARDRAARKREERAEEERQAERRYHARRRERGRNPRCATGTMARGLRK